MTSQARKTKKKADSALKAEPLHRNAFEKSGDDLWRGNNLVLDAKFASQARRMSPASLMATLLNFKSSVGSRRYSEEPVTFHNLSSSVDTDAFDEEYGRLRPHVVNKDIQPKSLDGVKREKVRKSVLESVPITMSNEGNARPSPKSNVSKNPKKNNSSAKGPTRLKSSDDELTALVMSTEKFKSARSQNEREKVVAEATAAHPKGMHPADIIRFLCVAPEDRERFVDMFDPKKNRFYSIDSLLDGVTEMFNQLQCYDETLRAHFADEIVQIYDEDRKKREEEEEKEEENDI